MDKLTNLRRGIGSLEAWGRGMPVPAREGAVMGLVSVFWRADVRLKGRGIRKPDT